MCICTRACVGVLACSYVYVRVCARTGVRGCACVCLYAHLYVYDVHVYMYVCMYIYNINKIFKNIK